jgi:hypothetical protein
LSKQEEVSGLYRDLERLSIEQRHRVQELEIQARELVEDNRRLQVTQDALLAEQSRSAELQRDLLVMREKIKNCLQDHRQDRRALRAQADHLIYLHQLLSAKTMSA